MVLLKLFQITDSRLSRALLLILPWSLWAAVTNYHRQRPIPWTAEIYVSLPWRLTVRAGVPAWQGEDSLLVADFALCFTRRRGAGVCLLHKGTSPTPGDPALMTCHPPRAAPPTVCGSGGTQAFRHSTLERESVDLGWPLLCFLFSIFRSRHRTGGLYFSWNF